MDPFDPDHTAGRMCLWYDAHANIVAITLDAWDADHELITTRVRPVGPFDDPEEVAAELAKLLTGQGVLF